jgi:hypothetical protein
MRKFGFLLILLLIPTIYATDFENMIEGDSITDDGWNITIIRIIGNETALLQVYLDESNVITQAVTYNENAKFDGMNITVTDIFYDSDPSMRFMALSTHMLWTHECDEVTDCNDHDECTVDRCDGYPRRCATGSSLQNISYCKDSDGCCASACTWKTDNDCSLAPCRQDSGCNDQDTSTNDSCESNRTCSFTPIIWCETGDNYCPDNCTFTMSSADNRDHDCSQESSCTSHADCNDGNASTINTCYAEPSTNPKECRYTIDQNALNEEEALLKTTSKDTNIEYNEPPKATQKYIEEIIEKVPFVKDPVFIGIIATLILAYLIMVFFKFKPEPEHI